MFDFINLKNQETKCHAYNNTNYYSPMDLQEMDERQLIVIYYFMDKLLQNKYY